MTYFDCVVSHWPEDDGIVKRDGNSMSNLVVVERVAHQRSRDLRRDRRAAQNMPYSFDLLIDGQHGSGARVTCHRQAEDLLVGASPFAPANRFFTYRLICRH